MADYPSGQRGLTVNQLATPTGVRIPHLPPNENGPGPRPGPFSFSKPPSQRRLHRGVPHEPVNQQPEAEFERFLGPFW